MHHGLRYGWIRTEAENRLRFSCRLPGNRSGQLARHEDDGGQERYSPEQHDRVAELSPFRWVFGLVIHTHLIPSAFVGQAPRTAAVDKAPRGYDGSEKRRCCMATVVALLAQNGGNEGATDLILWIIAAILVIAGIVVLVRGQVLFGIVLIVAGLLVGPGGVSLLD